MNHKIIDTLHYPKPNIDDFYNTYEFETSLLEYISNGEKFAALDIYESFFKTETINNIADSIDIQNIKSYIISISLLICHNVIKKGVSPYSAKAKYHAFSRLINKTQSQSEIINMGKVMVEAYTKQAVQNANTIDDAQIIKAIHYIHDNLGEDLNLDMVSAHAGLSRCYFCTKFKEETGMKFTDYLAYKRVEKSKYLLCSSDKSILDIAVLIGFNSQSYFSQQFKKYTKISPKKFRRDCKLYEISQNPSSRL